MHADAQTAALRLLFVRRLCAFRWAPGVQRATSQLIVKEIASLVAIGNRLVNAQLIEPETGHHAWARRYDSTVGDILAIQDGIIEKSLANLA